MLNRLVAVVADLDEEVEQLPKVAAAVLEDPLAAVVERLDAGLYRLEVELAKVCGAVEGPRLITEVRSPEDAVLVGVEPDLIR